MKNIFKFMGVALLACSMIMVSCKKDDENDNNVAEGINVTFNGNTWTGNVNNCKYYASYPALQFAAAETAESFPMFDEVIMTAETGNFNESATSGNFPQGSTHNYVEYYDETYLTNNQGSYFGDWWALQATTNINSVDLTALTVSATMNGTMFNAAEAFVDDEEQGQEAVGVDAASKAPYSASFGNVKMTAK